MITPTTKAEDHDVPISPADIVAQGLMTQVGGGEARGQLWGCMYWDGSGVVGGLRCSSLPA